MSFFALMRGSSVEGIGILLFAVLILPFAAFKARQGDASSAYLIATVAALANSLFISPSSYANPVAVLSIFLFPAIIASLFGHPVAGFLLVLFQTLLLATVLHLDGASMEVIRTFSVYFLLDMLSSITPIVVGAWILTVALGRLATMNQDLDRQVVKRTEALNRIMTLREQEITGVVHDINNRMMVARATIDELSITALTSGALPDALNDAERRVNAAMDAVSYLVEDMRTAVLLDNDALQLQCSRVDLAALLRSVVDQFSAVALLDNCQIQLDIADQVPPIWGDPSRLDRVLANLIDNALKYTRHMPRSRRYVRIRLSQQDTAAWIVISDSGPGLDERALALLGRPFTRFASARGTDGMGIGVYITRGIVELHQGSLRYESAGLGTGTTVTLSLPLALLDK